jgi:hypothetical protein
MAYGAGMSTLLRERGMEQARERKLYESEVGEAEDAARAESEGSSLWSTLGSIIGAGIGLATGGPAGAYKGYQYGKEVGKWGRKGIKKATGTEYDPEDYFVSTDVGKFGVSQKYDLEDINRQFEEADRSQFWKDVTGTGVSLLSVLETPDALAGEEWWDYGGGAPDWLRELRYGKPSATSAYAGTSLG